MAKGRDQPSFFCYSGGFTWFYGDFYFLSPCFDNVRIAFNRSLIFIGPWGACTWLSCDFRSTSVTGWWFHQYLLHFVTVRAFPFRADQVDQCFWTFFVLGLKSPTRQVCNSALSSSSKLIRSPCHRALTREADFAQCLCAAFGS